MQGGGIYSMGALTLRNSRFEDNTAGNGHDIYLYDGSAFIQEPTGARKPTTDGPRLPLGKFARSTLQILHPREFFGRGGRTGRGLLRFRSVLAART